MAKAGKIVMMNIVGNHLGSFALGAVLPTPIGLVGVACATWSRSVGLAKTDLGEGVVVGAIATGLLMTFVHSAQNLPRFRVWWFLAGMVTDPIRRIAAAM